MQNFSIFDLVIFFSLQSLSQTKNSPPKKAIEMLTYLRILDAFLAMAEEVSHKHHGHAHLL